jgi:SAM-dependent methyltransferase
VDATGAPRTTGNREVKRMTTDRNERVYEARWSFPGVVQLRPHLWRALSGSLDGAPLLEIGPGLRPTIPVEGGYFVDVSARALEVLQQEGAEAVHHATGTLPFTDGFFGGVFAFEVLEHVDHDEALVLEIARVLRPGGIFVSSVPLRMSRWSKLDELSAHVRRYEPEELLGMLERTGFRVEGVQVRCERLGRVRVKLQSTLAARLPHLTDDALQRIGFPLLAAWQRRFRVMGWQDPSIPIPVEATGITILSTRTRHKQRNGIDGDAPGPPIESRVPFWYPRQGEGEVWASLIPPPPR